MTYLALFLAFFKVGLFTLGGGYSSLPLIQEAVVNTGYITIAEYTDIVAIAETNPGPVSLDIANFVGLKLLGLPGALVATLGFVAPSFIFSLALAFLYRRYKKLTVADNILKVLRPAVTAFIAAAGIGIITMIVTSDAPYRLTFYGVDMFAVCGIILCAVLLRIKKLHIHPMLLMLAAGVLGGIYYYFAAV